MGIYLTVLYEEHGNALDLRDGSLGRRIFPAPSAPTSRLT